MLLAIKNLLLILFGVLLNASAQLFIKNGTNNLGIIYLEISSLIQTALKVIFEPFIFIGLLCYVISVAVWISVLSRTDVSVAYPLLSIGYVVNAIAAYFLYGENITQLKISGMIFIIIGTYLISQT